MSKKTAPRHARPSRPTPRARALIPGAVLAAAVALGAGPLGAQEAGAPSPGSLADVRAPGFRTTFQVTDRPERPPGLGYDGSNLEAEVILAHRFDLVQLDPDRPGRLELGFEVGVESRFFLEKLARDLIHADYRVGLPVTLRTGGWIGRLTLVHASSHLGDDFVRRFQVTTPLQVSRDGFELLVGRRLSPSVEVYGGGTWNFRVTPRVERTAARWGLEWRAGAGADEPPGIQPYAAADFRATSTAGSVAATGVAGLAFHPAGLRVRLEARGHAGPSTMGWFRNDNEQYLGLGLRVEP